MDRRTFLKTVAALTGSAAFFPWLQTEGQQFAIPPTLHHLTETTATFFFWLTQPTQKGVLQILSQGAPIREVAFTVPAENLRMQLVVDDLTPATDYTYTVWIDGVALPVMGLEAPWTGLSFRTPPYDFPLRVAAVGDSGFGDRVTQQLSAHMAQQNAHLFFHLGDVVYWMHEFENNPFINWNRKYFAPFQSLLQRMPHYATFGNHDQDAPTKIDDVPSYYWLFPPFNADQQSGLRSWYSFDYNGIQFISLNSQLYYSQRDLANQQEAWLDEKLQRTDVLYTVPFFHVSPYTSSAPHQYDGNILLERLVPRFEAANVPLVVSAHAHVYERLARNGITYIVAGAGSGTIYYAGEPWGHSQNLWFSPSYPLFDFYADHIHLTTYNNLGDKIDDLDLPLRG